MSHFSFRFVATSILGALALWTAALGGCSAIDCSETATCRENVNDAAADACVWRGPEDCTNGVDDDCNGAVDCRDPACQPDVGVLGFVCKPAFPTGFVAPVVVYEETGDGGVAPTAPACQGAYGTHVFLGHDNALAQAAQCECTCDAPQDLKCSAPTVGLWSNTNCDKNGALPVSDASVTDCAQIANRGGINSFRITDVGSPIGGKCTARSNTVLPYWNPNTGWATTGSGCSTARESPYQTGGCDPGQVCVENPPAALGGRVCAVSMASQDCASLDAGYTEQRTFWPSATDMRSCSRGTCQCGPVTGSACTPTVTLSPTCDGTQTTIGPTCLGPDGANYPPQTGPQTVFAKATLSVSPGTCIPSGDTMPLGQVVVNGPITVCCAP